MNNDFLDTLKEAALFTLAWAAVIGLWILAVLVGIGGIVFTIILSATTALGALGILLVPLGLVGAFFIGFSAWYFWDNVVDMM